MARENLLINLMEPMASSLVGLDKDGILCSLAGLLHWKSFILRNKSKIEYSAFLISSSSLPPSSEPSYSESLTWISMFCPKDLRSLIFWNHQKRLHLPFSQILSSLLSFLPVLGEKKKKKLIFHHLAWGCRQNWFSEKLGLLAQQGGGGVWPKPKFLLKFSKTKFTLVNG